MSEHTARVRPAVAVLLGPPRPQCPPGPAAPRYSRPARGPGAHDTHQGHTPLTRLRAGQAAAVGIGVAAGVTAAAGLRFCRKAATLGKVGKGHPLKHRALDLAAGALQQKYPSTR